MSRPRKRIPRVPHLLPEHIERRGPEPSGPAVLVDQFGRAHALAPRTQLGREPGQDGIAIIESSVSREHAQLEALDDAWRLTDLDSTNGTFADGVRVREPRELSDGVVVVLGDVAFLFYRDGSSVVARSDTEDIRATAASRVPADEAGLRLQEPSGGGGGVVAYAGATLQLGRVQFALLLLLAERRRAEEEREPETRGFVSSAELQASLPWNTPYPGDNHLKQAVRRVRRSLETIGLVDVIESRHGFGYRLLARAEIDGRRQ